MGNAKHKQYIDELAEKANQIFAGVRDEGAVRPHKKFGYEQSNMVRMERAVSWLSKGARLQDEEPSMGFIVYWISFEAIYSNDSFLINSNSNDKSTALDRITNFVGELIDRSVVEQISERLRPALEEVWPQVESLFANPYVNPDSWRAYYGGTTKAGSKRDPFAKEQDKPHRAGLRDPNQFSFLIRTLFQRLYYVRNMVFHGSATYKKLDNKERSVQIYDGLKVLAAVVPVLVHIMLEEMENDISDQRWGKIPYPRIKEG